MTYGVIPHERQHDTSATRDACMKYNEEVKTLRICQDIDRIIMVEVKLAVLPGKLTEDPR